MAIIVEPHPLVGRAVTDEVSDTVVVVSWDDLPAARTVYWSAEHHHLTLIDSDPLELL